MAGSRRPGPCHRASQTTPRRGRQGRRFEAYLPPALALWLLDRVEPGKFLDPSEAVFVILGEHEELEPHSDLRQELFKRRIQAAADDPRPGIPAEEAMERLREELKGPRPEPAR